MQPLPNALSDTTQPLQLEMLSNVDREAAELLAGKGYEVRVGLTQEFAEAISAMALEPSIREYCPNDCGKRFANLEATKQWLAKKRATFLLLKNEADGSKSLAGYGWMGAEGSEQVPTGKTTFAL